MTRRTFGAFVILAAAGMAQSAAAAERLFDLVPVPGGAFVMGDARGDRNEAPKTVTVKPFRIMRFEVTNRMFRRFVRAAGYVTLVKGNGEGHVWTDRWRRVPGATWRRPYGSGSTIAGKDDHPVVQISARDAAAFCRHYGMRLPSEAEWEFAARGTDGRRYPWGNRPPTQSGTRRANFGTVACCAADVSDGYRRTAPFGSYPAGVSPFGVHDMAGNVWEWTADPFPGRPGSVSLRGGGWGNDPYCLRVSYRHWNPPNIGLDMVGFRCVKDAN